MKMVQGYNFPDDATDEEIQEALKSLRAPKAPKKSDIPPAPEEMSWGEYGAGLGKSALSGLTFNWSDEAIARARSAMGGPDYETALKEEREQLKRFRDQYPVAAIGSEIAGSVPTMLVPGLGGAKAVQATTRIAEAAKPFIQAGITGLKQGVIGGVGGSEADRTTLEGAAEAAKEGLIGGGTGAVVGTGLTALGRAATPVVRRVGEFLKPEKYSEDVAKMKVLQDLQRSNLTPEQAQARYAEMEATGAAPSYFDVSPSLTSRAETIAQRPGASGEALTEDVIARQQGQRKRIMEQAKERLDVDKPYFDTEDAAAEALRQNAKPFYEKAYKAEIPVEAQAELQTIMDDVKKAFPSAIEDARRLFAAERRKDFKKTGTKEVDIGTDVPMREFEEIPKVRQWDYIVRGIGQVIDKETDAVTGKVSQLGGGAAGLKKEILNILDTNVPEFAKARAQYKGDMEVKEALLDARKNFLKSDPEELARNWAGMSEAEKEAYRAGALKSIRDSLFGSADYTDATKRIGQAVQDRREALNIIMPDAKNAKLFQDYLEAEARIANNAQRIKAGSPTARRLEGAKDLESDADITKLGMAKDIASAAIKGNIGNASTRLFNMLVKNPAIPEARANAIGKILRSGTPEEVDRATKSLVAFVEEQQKKEAARRLTEQRAAGVAGRLAGSRMPEQEPYTLTIRRGP